MESHWFPNLPSEVDVWVWLVYYHIIFFSILQPGRLDLNMPRVVGHKGAVLDIKWSPFDECVIASASEDCSVKVWEIPEDGLKENLTEEVVKLVGHQRRVGFLEWHPTAEHVLASAGYDCVVSS